MSEQFKLCLLWLTGGSAAIFFALGWLPAALVDGTALPTGHDAFYHARRILDVASGEREFYEFDSRMHVPEGSWITWPWGYDYAMATVARLVNHIAGVPFMRTLIYIPPIFVFVNAGLLIAVAALLKLRLSFTFTVVLCFALSPLTQTLHGAGHIDHHFIEYTMVLASLACGLWFFDRPINAKRAALLGVVLGSATVVHTGLFLLQLPLVATYFMLWYRRSLPPLRVTGVLCTALILALLGTLSMSAPFREGLFSFKLLSLFHLYVGVLTCAAVLLVYRLRPSFSSIVLVGGLAFIAVLPIANEASDGMRFVGREFVELDDMPEAQSFFTNEKLFGAPLDVTQTYSVLVWLLPVLVIGCVLTLIHTKERQLIYFCIYALFGVGMLLQQYRFHHFGSFAITIAPLLWLNRQTWLPRTAPINSALAIIFIAAHIPALAKITQSFPIGGNYDYENVRGIFPALKAACDARPGIVLADNNDGHYIRFHSECAVIANNFLMSERSLEKFHLVERLMRMSPDELLAERVSVDYLLVRRKDDVFTDGISIEAARVMNAGLREAFLWGEPSTIDHYAVIAEGLLIQPVAGSQAYVRLIQINR